MLESNLKNYFKYLNPLGIFYYVHCSDNRLN